MAIDLDENKPILVNFPNELLERVEDYQFSHRKSSRTKAILELIEKGLNETTREEPTK